jgi:hypothetical protein
MNRCRTAQLALSLSGLFGQDMAFERVTPLDRSATADLKALCSAFLGFHLRHDEQSLLLHLCLAGALPDANLGNLKRTWISIPQQFCLRTNMKESL